MTKSNRAPSSWAPSTHAPSTWAKLPLAAAFGLLLAAPAWAEDGTPEQREACAPDAVRLCQDTIPDVERTTACMKRHEAELSPRCHKVFSAAAPRDPEDAPRTRQAARPAPRDEDAEPDGRRYGYDPDDERAGPAGPPPQDYGPRHYRYLAPDGSEAAGPGGPEAPDGPRAGDRDHARAEILRACDEEMLDPRTCAEADRALGR